MRWRMVKVGDAYALEATWVVGENANANERTDRNVYASEVDPLGTRLQVLDGDTPENPERGADADREINVDE